MANRTILSRFAAAALAGASIFAASAAFAGEVTIWCWDPNFNVAIMKEAGARYTAKHPETTFNIVDFAKTDVEQKLQTALASGTTDALPDIVLSRITARRNTCSPSPVPLPKCRARSIIPVLRPTRCS